MTEPTRDHGGDLDAAIERYGGLPSNWIDLSTGINRQPYPLEDVSAAAWTDLPTKSTQAALLRAARNAYGTDAPLCALAGSQTGIQLLPNLNAGGPVGILTPTYNEFRASFAAHEHQVREVSSLDDLRGSAVAVVVNPNNPTGKLFAPAELLDLASSVGMLIVDESFMDAQEEFSLAPRLTGSEEILVLRSFGKFYGLAGLRLGFALGHAASVAALRQLSGPWPVSGIACELGARALGDREWKARTSTRLAQEVSRIDGLADKAGWRLLGGAKLFRLYSTPSAREAQAALAAGHIWSRIFPYSDEWIRLGLPGSDGEWAALEKAVHNLADNMALTSR